MLNLSNDFAASLKEERKEKKEKVKREIYNFLLSECEFKLFYFCNFINLELLKFYWKKEHIIYFSMILQSELFLILQFY